jgi:hypothetical protein
MMFGDLAYLISNTTYEEDDVYVINYVKLYGYLPIEVQDWLPLQQLYHPKLIETTEKQSILCKALFRILMQSDGTTDPDYHDLFDLLPGYIKTITVLMVGINEDTIEGLDYNLFWLHPKVQSIGGGWLTKQHLINPAFMSHSQMLIMLDLTTDICSESRVTDPNYNTVYIYLPEWMKRVCRLITQANIGNGRY